MELTTRRANRGEAERVLAFYYDLMDRMRGTEFCPYWAKDVFPALEDIRAAIDGENLFVAEADGGIVGAFILNHAQAEGYGEVRWNVEAPPERVGVIHLLAVHPSIQGHGAGRVLLARAAREGRERGDAVIRLDTLTWNRPARRLYEGFGFRSCGDFDQTYPTTGTIPFSMYELVLGAGDEQVF